jgi:phosphoribosylaminoimidazole-succinocarboxamide synthase
MSRRKKIYEGKAKILYEGPEPGTLVQYFKDDATAFNAQKKAIIEGKGVLNNRISEYLMSRLTDIGVPNHFMRRLNMREQLIREVEIIPLEVVCRNVAAGSISQLPDAMTVEASRTDEEEAVLGTFAKIAASVPY